MVYIFSWIIEMYIYTYKSYYVALCNADWVISCRSIWQKINKCVLCVTKGVSKLNTKSDYRELLPTIILLTISTYIISKNGQFIYLTLFLRKNLNVRGHHLINRWKKKTIFYSIKVIRFVRFNSLPLRLVSLSYNLYICY